MGDEEESMELSGSDTSSLSILHNLSLDVSCVTRDRSPRLTRRQTLPPNFATSPMPVSRPWKSLKLPVSPAPLPHTVRVSQKTFAMSNRDPPSRQCYSSMAVLDRQSYSPFNPVEAQSRDTESYSPIDLDRSNQRPESRYTSIKYRKLHNEMDGRSDTITTVSRRSMSTIRPLYSELSDCDDDTIDSKSSTTTQKLPSNSRRKCNESKTGHSHSNGKSSSNRKSESTMNGSGRSPIGVILVVVLVSICIGGYLFIQLGSCSSVFEVDLMELEYNLIDNVFGQHIAIKTIINALQTFSTGVKDGTGNRTLVLSFHGWTGVGKNYISKFVTEAFHYSRVFWYLASLHFPHRNAGKSVESVIESWITGNVSRCGVNMFVIDEMDKADDDLIAGIMAAIEDISNGPDTSVDSRNSSPITVIVFLSNSRAAQINQYVFSQTLIDRERDRITADEFTHIFQQNSKEWYERLKHKGYIDYFVPFLPLAEDHVRKCIVKDLVRKGRKPTDTLVKAIMEELSFFDMGGRAGRVSLTGCKRVQDKVDLHIDD